jgi:oligopeptidase B
MSLGAPAIAPAPFPEPRPPLRPPVAPRRPSLTRIHGETLIDEYAWLRDRDDPAVRAYLEAENAYADAVLERTLPLRRRLYAEMLSRIQETDQSVPTRKGEFLYYARTEQGRQYPILCRRGPGGAEAVTLDLNELARGEGYVALGAYEVSDDGRLLAYSVDDDGSRRHTLFVRDLERGRLLGRVAEGVGSVAWSADSRTLLYTTEEEGTRRQFRLLLHVLGSERHELLHEEPDPAFNLFVYRTRSHAFLVLAASSLTTSEARYTPSSRPEGPWRLVAPRLHGQEYELEHRGEHFYIRTNDTGRNFRLVRAELARPGREGWVELLPHRDGVMLEGVDCFADHLVALEREEGLPQLAVLDLRDGSSHRIRFPEVAYLASPEANPEFDTRTYRFSYESSVTPPSVFDYDMQTREAVLLKEQPVLGGYDRTCYTVERLYAAAPDGARVPVTVVCRKGLPRDGSAGLHLQAYGAYGHPLTPGFSSARLSLLDRGVVTATAHVRGGGELGKAWHDAGRLLHKPTSFTDLIAAADMLIEGGYGSRGRLVLEGGSAGGLLVAAVVNRRPDLCRAALLQVPFVDVIHTMLDESLPLTVGEFEEWGNPRELDAYQVLRSYCPYTNLRPGAYPAMLVRTSFNDSQVMYWEPAKYVARLRTLKTDRRWLLLKTNMAAGHDGAAGRYDTLEELALDYAFILTQMGF